METKSPAVSRFTHLSRRTARTSGCKIFPHINPQFVAFPDQPFPLFIHKHFEIQHQLFQFIEHPIQLIPERFFRSVDGQKQLFAERIPEPDVIRQQIFQGFRQQRMIGLISAEKADDFLNISFPHPCHRRARWNTCSTLHPAGDTV